MASQNARCSRCGQSSGKRAWRMIFFVSANVLYTLAGERAACVLLRTALCPVHVLQVREIKPHYIARLNELGHHDLHTILQPGWFPRVVLLMNGWSRVGDPDF